MIASIEPTPPDCTLTPYDYSSLTAIATCDTFGILRYGMHKSFTGGRAMALEAGHACHEVFAANRLWQLAHIDKLRDHAEARGRTLFGESRWSHLRSLLFVDTPERPENLSFCIEVLETSGFYDDPSDGRRTLAKLTETCIAYVDRTPTDEPIYVQDRNNPQAFIGIECPFDFLVTFHDDFQVRFVGRIDALHQHPGDVWPHENKTGARMDKHWLNSLRTSHQITGYAIFAGVIVAIHGGRSSWKMLPFTRVHGAVIPLPRSYDFGGIVSEIVERKPHSIMYWETWVREQIAKYERWKDNPFDAPKVTSACNKYFKTCQYIDFCTCDKTDQLQFLELLDTVKWSPLDEKIND